MFLFYCDLRICTLLAHDFVDFLLQVFQLCSLFDGLTGLNLHNVPMCKKCMLYWAKCFVVPLLLGVCRFYMSFLQSMQVIILL